MLLQPKQEKQLLQLRKIAQQSKKQVRLLLQIIQVLEFNRLIVIYLLFQKDPEKQKQSQIKSVKQPQQGLLLVQEKQNPPAKR